VEYYKGQQAEIRVYTKRYSQYLLALVLRGSGPD